MFDRFKVLPQLWRTGRLAWRLFRDSRVPTTAKLILGATALYLISPVDVLPDWMPILGQADDLVALMAGLNLFLRACPTWLVREHEDAIDGQPDDERASFGSRFQPRRDDPWGDDADISASNRRRPAPPTIEGEYQRIR